MIDTSDLPKWAQSLLAPIIAEINRTKLLMGDGISIEETESGEILSYHHSRQSPKYHAPKPPTTLKRWITLPYKIFLAGSASAEGLIQPTPNFNNPLSYYPFAVPSGSYTITFLDNVFQPIGTDGAITVSDAGISNLTTTSVPDPFAYPPGQRIYTFNWERTLTVSPLQPITDINGVPTGNVEEGRFYFTTVLPNRDVIPTGAIYAVVGTTDPNVFGQRAANIGQFTIHDTSDLDTFGGTI